MADDMLTKVRVSISATSSDSELIARATDAFARIAAGLAIDGMQIFVTVMPDEEKEVEEESQ